MSRPHAADETQEGPIMPPLIYETVAWLRHYSWIPFPPLPGESEAGAVPDPARSGHAAPLAGALIGAAAGLVIVLAAALGATDFVAASAGVLALLAITGGRAERALGMRGDGSGMTDDASRLLHYGIVAIALAVLLRTGALDALLLHGVWPTAFALAGACGLSRAAAIGFTMLRPVTSDAAAPAADYRALQWLGIGGIAIGVATVLPFFGLGAAVAGIAAAAGAVALASAFLPRGAGDADREFMAIAELAAEIAFLIAVVAFSSST